MRIAVYQMPSALKDVESNLARIARAAEAAAAMGADLLVTPELSAVGYPLGDDAASVAETSDGPLVGNLQALCERVGLSIVAGFAERAGERVYNSAVLAQPGSPRRVYRKCHLYGDLERQAFTPSDCLPEVFDIGGFKASMIICYDVEFPEMVRSAALAGAELLIVPTALVVSANNRRVAEQLVPTRAMENHIFIAYADLAGGDGVYEYQGHSTVVGPDGAFLARAGRGECLLVVDLDPAQGRDSKAELPYFSDRRPELYGSIATGRPRKL